MLANNRYDPYGNLMSQYGDATSVFSYTGEQWDAATGLEYLRARYYSSAQGRFFQHDPWPGDDLLPQSLNAYSYAGNNVVLLRDPSGRCYGQLEGLRKLPVEDSLCGYLDMSFAILNSPTATDNEKRLAGAYVGGYGISHAYLALGGVTIGAGLTEGAAGLGASQLYPAAVQAATKFPLVAKLATGAGAFVTAATAAADVGLTAKALSGDQDAQFVLAANYQAAGIRPLQTLPAVWSYLSRMKFFQFGIPCPSAVTAWVSDFKLRGELIEKALGGRSPFLPWNFPVIDRFRNGVATSMKSMELTAPSYQNVRAITSRLKGYVNELATWPGTTFAGVTIEAAEIQSREVLLAIPPGASPAQMQTLQEAQQWAAGIGVKLTITVVR